MSRTVLSTIQVNAKEVEDKALGILYPDEAPRTTTVSGLLMALAGMLERSDRGLQDADHAHSQELGDDDAVRAEREAQVTLNRRNEAMATWSAHYQGAADIMTGFCELIGRQDLADRVRPTSRRRAGLPEDGDTPVNPIQPGDPPVAPPR